MNEKDKLYTIEYIFDEVDSELHLTIKDGNNVIYTEDIIGNFEDLNDVELTCQEIAQSRGYWPAVFV